MLLVLFCLVCLVLASESESSLSDFGDILISGEDVCYFWDSVVVDDIILNYRRYTL